MTMKWNRESLLVTLTLLVMVIGLFYYGNQYFVVPVKEEADTLSVLVKNQESVLSAYEPSEGMYNEYESEYTLTETYLPVGDQSEQAMVSLEELAEKEKVSILSVSRLTDMEAVEGVPDTFVKNVYQAEVSSESSQSLRKLIERLMKEERTWNITSLSYEKNGENSYSGTFSFELVYYAEVVE